MSGSHQSRECPDDFEIIFIEKGRLECESHYRARRTTITRWLEERGKGSLIQKRAKWVAAQRRIKKKGASISPNKPKPKRIPKAERGISLKLSLMAADHLRFIGNGGWVIVPREDGNFIVGTRCRSPGEMLAMAERSGFD